MLLAGFESHLVKLVIIQNMMVPYEIPLFEGLSRHPKIDLIVYFCARGYKHRKWGSLRNLTCKHRFLRGLTLQCGNVAISLNPSIAFRIYKDRPDTIVLSGGYLHPTMIFAFLFAKVLRIPIIYRTDENANTRLSSSGLARILSTTLEIYIVRHVAAIICPSSASKRFYSIKSGYEIPIYQIHYTTMSDDQFIAKSAIYRSVKNELKRGFGILEEKIVIYVGRFSKEKGISYLVTAVQQLRKQMSNFALLLLGDGPLLNELMSHCKVQRMNNVYFPGFTSEEDKIRYYSISDIFVLPSLREPWGVVVNEAMLCGLPVIVTRVAGACDMVHSGENGIIIREGDSIDLRNALRSLLVDEISRSIMGKNARNIVTSEFTLAKRVENFAHAVLITASSNRKC